MRQLSIAIMGFVTAWDRILLGTKRRDITLPDCLVAVSHASHGSSPGFLGATRLASEAIRPLAKTGQMN
jgi:hypothetical protein